MDNLELAKVAREAGLTNPRVIPWKQRGGKMAQQLLWGEPGSRLSLLVPADADTPQVRKLITAAPNGVLMQPGQQPITINNEVHVHAPPSSTPAQTPTPLIIDNRPAESREDEIARRTRALRAPEPPAEPEALIQSAPQASPTPPPPNWSFNQLLARAGAEPTGAEDKRREAAKMAVLKAVSDAGEGAIYDQMRYELAIQAKNSNMRAIEMFQDEAGLLGTSVAALAESIIQDRHVRERRMMQVYALKAKALADLETAGDEVAIAGIEAQAVHSIRGTRHAAARS